MYPPQNAAPLNEEGLTAKDSEHLRLLQVFHYLDAGLVALIGLFPLVYLVLGGLMLSHPGFLPSPARGTPPPPQFVGWLMVGLGVVGFMLAESVAALTLLAGLYLGQRRHRTFILVVAGLHCLNAPLGLLLGVSTIIVLMRPTVEARFMRSH